MSEEQIEYRAVIKFLTLEGQSPSDIHDRMLKVYNEKCPSKATVYTWVNETKWRRDSLRDLPRSGRPKTVSVEEIIQKVEEFVMTDRRVKVREIANKMGISTERVWKILHEDLGMKKVCARWVPKLLTPSQKQDRVDICNDNLELLNENWNLLSTLITGDETWVHYYDPETKQQSMQWKHSDSPPPKKAKAQKSAGKVMLTAFWDINGPILLKFKEKNTTINGAQYAETLKELRTMVEEKRGVKKTSWVQLLHDNAPVHTARIATASAKSNHMEIIPHPPYSPDLAPSDYYLFRHLKMDLKGKRFSSDEEIKSAVLEWFDSKPKSFFSEGIMCLNSKWENCVIAHGEYIEKL